MTTALVGAHLLALTGAVQLGVPLAGRQGSASAASRLRASVVEEDVLPRVDWFTGFSKSSRAEQFTIGVDAIDRQVDGAVERLKAICTYPFFRCVIACGACPARPVQWR